VSFSTFVHNCVVCNRIFSPLSVPVGAPLKVCPQGYSCCTLEMEEKLSQQSHSDLKAPISQLNSHLQSTFKQRHSQFDRKGEIETHAHTHTYLPTVSVHLCPTCLCTGCMQLRHQVYLSVGNSTFVCVNILIGFPLPALLWVTWEHVTMLSH
jgi:hypothetical protein